MCTQGGALCRKSTNHAVSTLKWRRRPKAPQTDLLQGTLDLLILKALALQELHGMGVLRRIAQITGGAFDVKVGSLFPALHRMEQADWLTSFWGESETNRCAKFYSFTKAGKEAAAHRVGAVGTNIPCFDWIALGCTSVNSQYLTELPPKEVLERKLHGSMALSRGEWSGFGADRHLAIVARWGCIRFPAQYARPSVVAVQRSYGMIAGYFRGHSRMFRTIRTVVLAILAVIFVVIGVGALTRWRQRWDHPRTVHREESIPYWYGADQFVAVVKCACSGYMVAGQTYTLNFEISKPSRGRASAARRGCGVEHRAVCPLFLCLCYSSDRTL